MIVTAVSFAVLVSTLLCVVATYIAVRQISRGQWLTPADRTSSPFARRVSWLSAIGVFPFAWFLGFVVGGNFGGAIASNLSEGTGLPAGFLIPLGIGVGIFLCTTLLSIAVALLGFAITRCVERANINL